MCKTQGHGQRCSRRSRLKRRPKGDGRRHQDRARRDAAAGARVDGSVTLIHWNVGGLNGLLNGKDAEARKALLKLVAEEAPDVLAISEHKLSEEKKAAGEKALLDLVPGYAAHWAICTAKKGYSGVVCLVKDGTQAAVLEVDTVGALHEGRTITLALDGLSVVAAYVPNSGQSLDRLSYRTDTWEPAMLAHLQKLEATAPCVLFGDLNVAHLDADIWNVGAKHLVKSAGTTPQERAAFGKLLDAGYVDAFRHLHPDATGCFSYWSTRSGRPAPQPRPPPRLRRRLGVARRRGRRQGRLGGARLPGPRRVRTEWRPLPDPRDVQAEGVRASIGGWARTARACVRCREGWFTKVLDQSVTSTVLSLTHTGDSAHTSTHMQNWAAGSFTHDARLAVSRLARSRAERGPRARAYGARGGRRGSCWRSGSR